MVITPGPKMEHKEDLLAEIEAVIGVDAAQVLVHAYGGTVIYIPGKAYSNHPFNVLIGVEAFAKLANHFRVGETGIRILMPMGRNAKIRECGDKILRLSGEGISTQEIAKRLKIHVRTVYRHLAAKKMRLR